MITDHQRPNDRDECYIIIDGTGKFEIGDEIVDFAPGDFLFVPAGLPHRFIDFGEKISTWVNLLWPRWRRVRDDHINCSLKPLNLIASIQSG